MHVKIFCNKCGSEIVSLSAIRQMTYRTDFIINPCFRNANPFLVEVDKEYFNIKDAKIIFNCLRCGEIMVDWNGLDGFMIDHNQINLDRLLTEDEIRKYRRIIKGGVTIQLFPSC